MLKSSRKIYPVYFLVDAFFIILSFYVPYIFRHNSLRDVETYLYLPNIKEYSSIFFLWLIFITISFKRRNLYFTDRNLTIPKEISRVIISIFWTAILISAVIFFAQYKFSSRLIFLANLILLCFFLSVWRIIKRLIVRNLIAKGFHNVNVLIVGAEQMGRMVFEEIKQFPWWGFKVIGFLDDKKAGVNVQNMPVLGNFADFSVIVQKHFIDEVIITIPSQRQAVSCLIKEAKKMHLGVRVVPENFEEPLQILSINYLGIIPLITYKERISHPAEFVLKRIFDFLISSLILVTLFPLLIIIAILIKMDSMGPVFYVQKRVGTKGNHFDFYKFRSMIREADKLKPHLLKDNEVKDGVIFKMKNDPRITNMGRWMRRYSLDELPQIFNVIKGDMSLIGPRPFPIAEVEKHNHIHMQRLAIRPGITGLSQVRGRSDLSFKKWVKWDLWYVNNWSFGLDLKILWWTIPAVIKGRGAY